MGQIVYMALKDTTGKEKQEIFTNNNEADHEHGKHPNSLKNLKKWDKGMSGNPIGRPFKYQKLKELLMELGKEITLDYYEKPMGTRQEQLLKTIWNKAIKGDIQFTKILIYLGVFDD